jgi:hypothetical protein
MKAFVSPIAVMILASLPLCAQWPDYKTAGIPRDTAGKPILDAPTPKAADGHPDLSGIWSFRGPARPSAIPGFPAPAGDAAPPPPRPARPAPPLPPDPPESGPPLAAFFNIGVGIKGGLPLQPWAADLLKSRMAENAKENPDAHCLPLGLMQLHTHPQPRKIIQSPGVIVILYEAQAGIRQIFTDGRALPPTDAQPWWFGYSAGKWDGDTLVVETTGFRDDVWLDVNGSPLTNSGKMTESFRRPTFGTLEIEVTVEDPKAYTKPFTVKVNQRIMPDTDLIEFVCQENDRSGPHLVGK